MTSGPTTPTGDLVSIDGETYYRISSSQNLAPFFMTIPSNTDLWMFITSRGGLTAGRVDADRSLFPYQTVDLLHDAHRHTGPITLIRVSIPGERDTVWEPFADVAPRSAPVHRCLYKNVVGNRVLFEETRPDLGLTFRYRWSACDAFGFVRTASLRAHGPDAASGTLVDGVRNVLPYGVPLALQQRASCLVDAYKRTDRIEDLPLAVFSLTAEILDRAEAAEQLRANVAWCHGLGTPAVSLSARSLESFRAGAAAARERVLTGQRGGFFVETPFALASGEHLEWDLVLDVGLGHVRLVELIGLIRESTDLDRRVRSALDHARDDLVRIVASADALQCTGHPVTDAHHVANVLYNTMRGGVFASDHDVPVDDFGDFLSTRNRRVRARSAEFLRTLPRTLSIEELRRVATRAHDPDLERLAFEYLPIGFGRRHGDPSRPWNRFAIQVKNSDGSPVLYYEGNWRDIFQNWEALALSFPDFLPNLIATFVNASTLDGFNPYRLTRDGIEWEIPDPDDPWSYIGYWGDHQIVYLLRLLEALGRTSPATLRRLLDRRIFAYADVPYRLRPYADILRDPHATIDYDHDRAARVDTRVAAVGSDGKLVTGTDGSVSLVTLLEKLLVPALSKLSNLVPDGGIWMNTQRPEWNDANNALVGNGLSMVTLFHLRRYLVFLDDLLADDTRPDPTPWRISAEVAEWMADVGAAISECRRALDRDDVHDAPETADVRDADRLRTLDALGEAFSRYRERVYVDGLSAPVDVTDATIRTVVRDAIAVIDHAIAASRRPDGLHHTYNLLSISTDDETASVRHLYEMLEGQVAALSSGALGVRECVELAKRMVTSRLYRPDQRSFLLYPERELPGFLDRNAVSAARVEAIGLLSALEAAGDVSLIERDGLGTHRFHPDLSNARDVSSVLDRLARSDLWRDGVTRDRARVLALFEDVFAHREFTGRSGTMYGYEGLGCIYWHMVAKLLLAIQEVVHRAIADGEPDDVVNDAIATYHRVRGGLGFEKTVVEYGAFPTDPYSHTPAHAGAQQPGMTGQVKEEILTRFGELGVAVEGGCVRFAPRLLRATEFRPEAGTFAYVTRNGARREIDMAAESLAFTYCQVPVVYTCSAGAAAIRTSSPGAASVVTPGDLLDEATSASLLGRRGEIEQIDVTVPRRSLARS